MKKLAFLLVVFGSGLTAFGFSGWHLATSVLRVFLGPDAFPANGLPDIHAGWSLGAQLEITIGVGLLVCGLLLRRDSR